MIVRKALPALAVSALVAGLLPATSVQAAPAVTAAATNPLRGVAFDLGVGTSSQATHVSGQLVAARYVVQDGRELVGLARLDDAMPAVEMVDDRPVQAQATTQIAGAATPYLVGTHYTGTASTRAFTYHSREGTVRDVPSFGGLLGRAAAVDGDWIAGSAQTGSGAMHAFVAALTSAGAPRDLGTLGGRDSEATDVAGQLVVGQSDRADGSKHAFYARLDQAGSPLVDLGTLGGADSRATAVDGTRVVGGAQVASGAQHAFVRDVSAVAGPVTDLGTLGGTTSRATGVSGSIVVGTSARADGSTASWYVDLVAGGAMRDLGTLASGQAAPSVDGSYVVGTRETANGRRGFVRDVSTGDDLELAPPAGQVGTTAVAVDGDVVVGTSRAADGTSRAMAWRLTREPADAIGFPHAQQIVTERSTTIGIPVTRTGDLRSTVSETWTVTGPAGEATAGQDFVARRGTLTFAAGQARTTVPVRLLADRRREGREDVLVTLGNGRTTRVTIAPSDQQPDLRVRVGRQGDWVGSLDRVRLPSRPGETRVVQVRVGHAPGPGKARIPLVLRASTPRGVEVRWSLQGRRVDAIARPGFSLMAPAANRNAAVLTARVRVLRGSAYPARLNLKASWQGDTPAGDIVGARLVRR